MITIDKRYTYLLSQHLSNELTESEKKELETAFENDSELLTFAKAFNEHNRRLASVRRRVDAHKKEQQLKKQKKWRKITFSSIGLAASLIFVYFVGINEPQDELILINVDSLAYKNYAANIADAIVEKTINEEVRELASMPKRPPKSDDFDEIEINKLGKRPSKVVQESSSQDNIETASLISKSEAHTSKILQGNKAITFKIIPSKYNDSLQIIYKEKSYVNLQIIPYNEFFWGGTEQKIARFETKTSKIIININSLYDKDYAIRTADYLEKEIKTSNAHTDSTAIKVFPLDSLSYSEALSDTKKNISSKESIPKKDDSLKSTEIKNPQNVTKDIEMNEMKSTVIKEEDLRRSPPIITKGEKIIKNTPTVPQTETKKLTKKKKSVKLIKNPAFPGGETAMLEYLAHNLSYRNEIKGTVWVSFFVETSGKITGSYVIFTYPRSVDEGFQAEAIRVVNNMPNWIPGEEDGRKVRMLTRVQIDF